MKKLKDEAQSSDNKQGRGVYLRRMRISTARKLDTSFTGEYRSAFKGTGLAFESVREYQYGDDVRHIDWNVSARMNNPYIKEYIEERELSILLMIDISASTGFGGTRTKRELILELVSLLLDLAQMSNDRISVLLFSDQVEKFIHPRKGRRFILSVLDEIMKFRPTGTGTDIGAAVDFARRVLKKRSVVFCISDFLDENNDYFSKLRILARRHDIIPVQVYDPLEYSMNFHGLAEFFDLETGELLLCDTIPEEKDLPITQFMYPGLILRTDEPIEQPLIRFFKRRNSMQRRAVAQ